MGEDAWDYNLPCTVVLFMSSTPVLHQNKTFSTIRNADQTITVRIRCDFISYDLIRRDWWADNENRVSC